MDNLQYENKQRFLDKLTEALRETDAAGHPLNNRLKSLTYLKFEDGKEIVRPEFEDGSGKNGEYDVNVKMDSCIAMLKDITENFVKRVW